jgi:hypothetical protein
MSFSARKRSELRNDVVVQKAFIQCERISEEHNCCHDKQSIWAKFCGWVQCCSGLIFFLDNFVSNQVEQARPILFESRNKEKMRSRFAQSHAFDGTRRVELSTAASTTVLHPI